MDNASNKEIGKKIFIARKKMKMSRAKLGEIVNLHESTVKRYEDGDIKSLDIEKMKEFAKALVLDPAYLIGFIKYDSLDIQTIFNELNFERQQDVYNYATRKLREQKEFFNDVTE